MTTKKGVSKVDLRHELKHRITPSDALAIKSRLSLIATPDAHAKNGVYFIRSLYFDNIKDKALREKLDGVPSREKFRIRYYNGDLSYIVLEKKIKVYNLCKKEQAVITESEARELLSDGTRFFKESGNPLLNELYLKRKTDGLFPKANVDYRREAFTYPAGNVRVTIDSNIRSSTFPEDFFDSGSHTLPAEDDPIILEIKFDGFLPDIIKHATATNGTVLSK